VNHRRRAIAVAWLGGLALACLALTVALAAGPSDRSLIDLAASAFDPTAPDHAAADAILRHVRLPRALGSFLVGACLSLAGVLVQAATRNPIADPYLVGTSAGATLAAVLAAPLAAVVATTLQFDLDTVLPFLQPLAALLGALAAVSAAFTLARAGGPLKPERVLLAGLVLTAFFGAATSFVLYRLSDVRLRAATWWLMGGVSLPSLWAALPGVLILGGSLVFALLQAPRLNALGLGEEAARGVGVDEARLGRRAVVWSSALAAAAVSLAGIIGFVGLLVPHGLRAVVGRDHRALVPGAVLVGGAFLCAMDALARVVVAPAELPLGILTALAGCPVLLALVRVRSRPPVPVAPSPRRSPPNQAAPLPTAPATAAIGCNDLAVTYHRDAPPVIAAVTLAVPAGHLCVLAGPNGSGKTTLLRALAGLQRPARGTLIDDGQPRTRNQPAPGRVAYLPQDPVAEPGVRVDELVAIGRSPHLHRDWRFTLFGEPGPADRAAIDRALDLADLTALRDARVDRLSGGQRQRAFVAMVLCQEPAVLLLDEPTANLDRTQSVRLMRLLRDAARTRGLAVVVALHDVGLAVAVADHLVVVDGGRVVAAGAGGDEAVRVALWEVLGFGVE
jgi:iron complex transport system permease protein